MIKGLLGSLPLFVAWLEFYALARELAARHKIDSDRRLSWLLACVGWGTTLTAITELASTGHHFDAPTIFAAWVLVSLALFFAVKRLAVQRGLTLLRAARWWFDFRADKHSTDFDTRWMLMTAALLIAVLGFIAVATPTTTSDALTYHLPRVMHWLQNQSVHQFATNNSRQNEFGPWAGFALAHLRLLSGSDRLFNLVQWFAMVSNGVGASLIAQRWAAAMSRRGERFSPPVQRLAGVFCFLLVITLPIGVVESITTQNDLVAAFWLTTFMWLSLFFIDQPSNAVYSIGAGLALGLGALTKSTLYIYAAPWVISLGIWLFHVPPLRLRLQHLGIFIFTFVVINAPHMLRNYAVAGSPLGSGHILALERNRSISFSGFASNLIRNLSLETNTGISPLTQLFNKLIAGLHRLTGRDWNDPDTTYYLGEFFFPDKFNVADSYASNFWHLLPAGVAIAILIVRPKRNSSLLAYGGLVAAGFVLFCALLRWQIWHSRLHLAWFVALMPLVAVVLSRDAPRWLVRTAAGIVALVAFYCVFHNNSRPILNSSFWDLPREEKYLAIQNPKIAGPLIHFSQDAIRSGGKDVGLIFQFDDFEQAVWLMLKNRGFSGRIDHLGVTDASAKLSVRRSVPSVILTSLTNDPPAAFRKIFPYRRDYPPYATYWSEATSQWCEFIKQNPFGLNLPVKPDQKIPFADGQINLGFRSVRSGALRVSGKISGGTDGSIAELRVRSGTGFSENIVLSNGAFTCNLPMLPPQEIVMLSLAPNHTNAVLHVQDWAWEVSAPQRNLIPKNE